MKTLIALFTLFVASLAAHSLAYAQGARTVTATPAATSRPAPSRSGHLKEDAGWQREHMAQNRLAILPGVTHYEMFLTPELVSTVLPFLDGKSSVRSWGK